MQTSFSEEHQHSSSPDWTECWFRWVVTVCLVGACCYAARVVIVPLIFAVFVKVVLKIPARALRKIGLPLFLASTLVTVASAGLVVGCVYLLAQPAREWAQRLPRIVDDIARDLRPFRRKSRQIRATVEKVEGLISGAHPRAKATHASSTTTLATLLRQSTDILSGFFIVFALGLVFLGTDGSLTSKIVRLAGKDQQLPVVAVAIDRVEHALARYLMIVTLVNVALGGAVAILMWRFGLPNPVFWGAMATILNFIPYIGAFIGIVTIAVVAYTVDGSVAAVAGPAACYLALTSLEAWLITPKILGRGLRLSPTAILISLLLFGWLWGVAGVVLAAPMLIAAAVVSDHVKELRLFGILVGPAEESVGSRSR